METVTRDDEPLRFMRYVPDDAMRPEDSDTDAKFVLGALSLNPWMEVAVDRSDTQYVRALHGNAALEQAEYDTAGRYLSPAKPENRIPAKLAADAFRASVRDQFMQASDFVALNPDEDITPSTPVLNWLPHAERVDATGAPLAGPQLRFEAGEIPAILLEPGVGPDSRLDILNTGKPGFRWLNYGLAWHNRSQTPPQLRITAEPEDAGFSARHAAADLVFDPATASCIAASGAWVAVGEANSIHLRQRSAPLRRATLTLEQGEIRQLAIAAPQSGNQILVVADNGGYRLWTLSPELAITYHADSNRAAVRAQLPLTLDAGDGAPQLSARLLATAELGLETFIDGNWLRAFPSLYEKSIYGFVLRPLTVARSSGERLLLLWPEENLDPPRIGGILMEDTTGSQDWHLAGLEADSEHISGIGLRLSSSTPTPEDDGTGVAGITWYTHEFDALTIQGSSGGFTANVLIAGQLLSSDDNPPTSTGETSDPQPHRFVTGILSLKKADRFELQLPIKLQLPASPSTERVLTIVPGYYVARKLGITTLETGTAAEIGFPGTGSTTRYAVQPSLDSGTDNDTAQEMMFVHLSVDQSSGIRLQLVSKDSVPLSPCLDSRSWRGIPQLPTTLPRLLHRGPRGSQMRPNLNDMRFYESGKTGIQTDWEPTDGNYGLSPIVKDDKGLGVLMNSLWLQKLEDSPPIRQTESVISLRRPPPGSSTLSGIYNADSPLTALLNISDPEPESSSPLLGSERLRDLLQQSGAGGFLIHRITRNNGTTELRPLRSSIPVEIDNFLPPSSVAQRTRPMGTVLHALAAASLEDRGSPTEIRILSPRQVRNWSIETSNSYHLVPNDTPGVHPPLVNKEQDVCSPPKDESAWGRSLSLELPTAPAHHWKAMPFLRMIEQTAWQRPAALALAESLPVSAPSDAPTTAETDVFHPYLPKNLTVLFGPDKRGGMISHSIHAYALDTTGNEAKGIQFGGGLREVLRDPPRFSLPPGATIPQIDDSPVPGCVCDQGIVNNLPQCWRFLIQYVTTSI